MKAIIYAIISPSNKSYIGSTKAGLDKRINKHKHLLFKGIHHSSALQNAFNKYRRLDIRILEEFEYVTYKDILNKEQYYLDLYEPEYNICKLASSGALNSKAILCMNIITKEILEFNSGQETQRVLKIGNISNALLGKLKSVGNYIVKFKDNDITFDELLNKLKTKKLRTDIGKPKLKFIIKQINLK